ncbi:MAG: hypothetical protein NC548_22995 [Lachnospiraceae bacterium]|nr:hypothetical protein [Lachnospiraceae bacterium]
MKEFMTYECGFCKAKYNNREECMACEVNHKRIKSVIGRYEEKCKIPSTMCVTFEDGTKQWYYRAMQAVSPGAFVSVVNEENIRWE